MDFTYDSEQNALREAVRGLLGKAYADREHRRTVTADGPGLRREDLGAAGRDGPARAALRRGRRRHGRRPDRGRRRRQEIGRCRRPSRSSRPSCSPAAWSPPSARPSSGSRSSAPLPRASALPAFAHAEPGTRWTAEARAVTAARDGDGWTLTGVKEPVPHGARADVLVVSAALPDGGTGLFLVARATRRSPATPPRRHPGRERRLRRHPRDAARRARSRPDRRHRAGARPRPRSLPTRRSARWRRRCGRPRST